MLFKPQTMYQFVSSEACGGCSPLLSYTYASELFDTMLEAFQAFLKYFNENTRTGHHLPLDTKIIGIHKRLRQIENSVPGGACIKLMFKTEYTLIRPIQFTYIGKREKPPGVLG